MSPLYSHKKLIVPSFIILLLIVASIFLLFKKDQVSNPIVENTLPEPIPQSLPEKEAETAEAQVSTPLPTYYSYTTVSTNPAEELVALVGQEHMATILRINRINSRFIQTGDTLSIPEVFFPTFKEYSPFPFEITTAQDIPKLIIVSQHIQAFAVYESGILIKWGPVSTGKAESPTPNGLFFTNWKGKSVISTIDDGWLLKWNFNLDNRRGISLHEYALPGYPASHACVRLFGSDAQWIYYWADQWILSGNTQLAKGTPTIIFGDYDYTQDAPWKQLPTNPNALTITAEEVEELITIHHDTITNAYAQRQLFVTTSVPTSTVQKGQKGTIPSDLYKRR